jgi:hypothetical protein
MTNPYRVECWRGGICRKIRKFTTAEKAVNFANDWHDEHEGIWDVQIITPSNSIHQTNRNGNTKLASLLLNIEDEALQPKEM